MAARACGDEGERNINDTTAMIQRQRGNRRPVQPEATRNEVLALDIATVTGWCTMEGGGEWDFHDSLARNGNRKFSQFYNTLYDFIVDHGIKRVVVEDVTAGGAQGGFKTSVILAYWHGILNLICDELELPRPARVNLRTIKKFATGNGNADKADMVAACRRRWGRNPVSDNEADATHLFFYYLKINNL